MQCNLQCLIGKGCSEAVIKAQAHHIRIPAIATIPTSDSNTCLRCKGRNSQLPLRMPSTSMLWGTAPSSRCGRVRKASEVCANRLHQPACSTLSKAATCGSWCHTLDLRWHHRECTSLGPEFRQEQCRVTVLQSVTVLGIRRRPTEHEVCNHPGRCD